MPFFTKQPPKECPRFFFAPNLFYHKLLAKIISGYLHISSSPRVAFQPSSFSAKEGSAYTAATSPPRRGAILYGTYNTMELQAYIEQASHMKHC